MHDHDDHDFAYASDNALKSLRAIFMLAGRTADEALVDAVAVVVSLLDNGGTGWIERLIDAQGSAELRMMAKVAARDLELRDVDARTRSRVLLLCLTRQTMLSDVFDAVACQRH